MRSVEIRQKLHEAFEVVDLYGSHDFIPSETDTKTEHIGDPSTKESI